MSDSWQVEYGFGGAWARVTSDTFDGWLYLRFALDGRRRPYLAEMYYDGRGAEMTQRVLRELPLSNLIAFVLSDAHDWLNRGERGEPGPNLSMLASHFATLWMNREDWVANSMRAQLDIHPDINDPEPGDPPPADGALAAPTPLATGEHQEDGLSDAFLSRVAENYLWLRRQGVWPVVPELAAMVGVSNRTVNGWVAKARDRNLMPPASGRRK